MEATTDSDNCSSSFYLDSNQAQQEPYCLQGKGVMHTSTITVSDGNGNSNTCTVKLTGDDIHHQHQPAKAHKQLH